MHGWPSAVALSEQSASNCQREEEKSQENQMPSTRSTSASLLMATAPSCATPRQVTLLSQPYEHHPSRVCDLDTLFGPGNVKLVDTPWDMTEKDEE